MNRTRLLFAISAGLVGCAGLIGVPDLTFDGDNVTGADGSLSPEGSSATPTDASQLECKTDVAVDPNNCGRCGHSCAGGACVGRACQPVVLADFITRGRQIALDADHVYFAAEGDGTVSRVKKDATQPAEVIRVNATYAFGVAVAGNTLYTTDRDGIYQCTLGADKASCGASTVKLGAEYISRFVATSAGQVVYTTQGDVLRLRSDDAGAISLNGGNTQPYDVKIAGNFAYFTSFSRGLPRAHLDGGLFDGGGKTEDVGPSWTAIGEMHLAVDGDRVFWGFLDDDTKTGFVFSATHADPLSTRITYTTKGTYPIGITADAQYVYWCDAGTFDAGSNGDGRLLACPRGGCGPEPLVLATGLRSGGAMAIDETAIYWMETNSYRAGGRLRKIAKP